MLKNQNTSNARLIVGLGNPEPKYFYTRHNLGFLAINFLVNFFGFSEFKEEKKVNSFISKQNINNDKVIFALPNTFMNNSGIAVNKLKKYYKVPLNKIVIIHDDVDLDVSRMKISVDSSAAGHKGVQSIINYLKSQNFLRIRIGIKPNRRSSPTESYVLKKMSKEEEKIYFGEFEKLPEVMELIFKDKIEKAMSIINQ